ncbi:hypothetical protein LY90DRAFT_663243 [Neocallimastix californiae]|uniref:Uncharacterized protein n=1 Tax=Neocallimastix californiae TaxID=1754190 RepID=A0A1Y2FTU2_9FUNG|nr:hypothetical protein LY90DRAFT_663243 [Neocallimastix californiae]|eukprot:ORY86606.1 hypothetical protein LY90DRAFT_663243 [Neocallimastix californiae]
MLNTKYYSNSMQFSYKEKVINSDYLKNYDRNNKYKNNIKDPKINSSNEKEIINKNVLKFVLDSANIKLYNKELEKRVNDIFMCKVDKLRHSQNQTIQWEKRLSPIKINKRIGLTQSQLINKNINSFHNNKDKYNYKSSLKTDNSNSKKKTKSLYINNKIYTRSKNNSRSGINNALKDSINDSFDENKNKKETIIKNNRLNMNIPLKNRKEINDSITFNQSLKPKNLNHIQKRINLNNDNTLNQSNHDNKCNINNINSNNNNNKPIIENENKHDNNVKLTNTKENIIDPLLMDKEKLYNIKIENAIKKILELKKITRKYNNFDKKKNIITSEDEKNKTLKSIQDNKNKLKENEKKNRNNRNMIEKKAN